MNNEIDANIYIEILMQELIKEKEEKMKFKALYVQTVNELEKIKKEKEEDK